MKKFFFIFSLFFTFFITVSCSNDNQKNENYSVQVKLTDAPAPFDAVNIEVIGIELITNSGKFNLETNNQIYNLLDLSNGINVLLAEDVITEPIVKQIRLILGSQNSIVVNSETFPLSTPSAQQTGLKLLINKTLQPNFINTILIDFDAHSSIVTEGNGTYSLKPVLRNISLETTETLKGNITNENTMATVTAIDQNNNEYTTITNENGEFMILGLPEGFIQL